MFAERAPVPNIKNPAGTDSQQSVDPASIPALLMTPEYLGTLAAVRCLGARGVNIAVGVDALFAPAVWSRWTSSRVRAPSAEEGPAIMLEWLLRQGRESPGMVLYPTCDHLAWLIARYATELGVYFRLFTPGIDAVETLLDKSLLFETCVALGIPAPQTWLPRSDAEVEALLSKHGRLLIKPRTQAFFTPGGKGEVVTEAAQAREVFRRYAAIGYPRELLSRLPDLTFPILQEYVASGTNATYSVSGFVDKHGRVISSRASTKVTQFPTRIGVGLQFEAAPLDPSALRSIERMCRHLDYFGVFEVEFVRRGDELLMVDFNPRYFGQMEFDIARGSPLPWLVHLAALDAHDRLSSAAAAAHDPNKRCPAHYVDRVGLGWRIATALASGHHGQLPKLRRTLAQSEDAAVDATWRAEDPSPAAAAAASRLWSVVRHPRAFLNSILHFDDGPP